MSPTQRTLAKLRSDGYLSAIVEHWNPFAKIRQDLFGFADIIAIHPEKTRVLFVQCTTDGNMSVRVKKLSSHANVALVRGNHDVEVWGWGKKGKQGKRKLWEVRIVKI